MDTLVMYIILRRDLQTSLKWPVGALFTQVAHAATACIWTYKDDPLVLKYMQDMDNMHKITLQVESEDMLNSVAKKLQTAQIQHRVWTEDGMNVCIAIKPQPRSPLKDILGHLKLYK